MEAPIDISYCLLGKGLSEDRDPVVQSDGYCIESVEKFQSEVRKNGRFKSACFVLKVHFNIEPSIWLNLCSLGNSQQEVIFSGRLRAGLIVMRQKLTNRRTLQLKSLVLF